ncbi:hypothetical protein [Shewanella salipaludis]|uniref:Uncharacterized protein n=1 Tax=Shewanella salipaludis TaxID=2723052 RepID=A0A972FT26_9GAMM|nr:hypothetical protein [Shewanella salipaludis]NMH65703.1 hypothetical protein [Shewanella salipaludis]
MNEKDPWKNNTVTNKNTLWLVVASVLLILYVSSGDKIPAQHSENIQAEAEKIVAINPSQNAIELCREQVSDMTYYTKERLTYVGSDAGNVVITYLNDFDKVYKFKCVGNKVKLYAEGSRTWIPM